MEASIHDQIIYVADLFYLLQFFFTNYFKLLFGVSVVV